MDEYTKNQISKIIDWITRQRRPGFVLITAGVSILGAKSVFNFAVTGTFSWGSLSIGTTGGNLITDYLVPLAGIILCSVGLFLITISEIQSHRQNSRKRLILITGNGLRTTLGTGLEKIAGKVLKGNIHPLPIDITQRIRDGFVIEPESTFKKQILPAKENIGQLIENAIPEETQVAYGGFLPVPFTFFLGNALDDKGHITVFDWDRQNEEWRLISEENNDDGESFTSEDIRILPSKEIVLVVSCSYKVSMEQVEDSFKNMSIEHLKLENNSFGNHWSLTKQRRLSLEFAEKIKSLSDKGIQTVHLILAAQSSLVLNLGRRYDSRNMPDVIVYQYERSGQPPYPWGIYGLSNEHEDGGFVKHNNPAP